MSQRTRKGSATAQRATNTVAMSAAPSAPSSALVGDIQPRPHSAPPEDRICRIESAIRSFFQVQQTREERQEREAELQNQRWRSLEHQFQQLQTLVGTGGLDRQSREEEEEAHRAPDFAPLQNPHPGSLPRTSRPASSIPRPDVRKGYQGGNQETMNRRSQDAQRDFDRKPSF
ncbi:unnamed protein product [Arctogadus glacialis]